METNPRLNERLRDYAASVQLGKGTLALFLVVTDHLRERGLPLDADNLVVDGGGQVRRLGRPAVQKILARHGITEILAREGGRTSMGSVQKMRRYVGLLNRLHEDGLADPDSIEAFWIAKVRDFLARRRAVPGSGPGPAAEPVAAAARCRPKPAQCFPGAVSAGGRSRRDRTSAGIRRRAVEPSGRRPPLWIGSDRRPPSTWTDPRMVVGPPGRALFGRGDSELHVTAGPSEAVIADCRQALDRGRHPILITLGTGTAAATHLAETAGIREQIEVFDIEHFLVVHLHLRSGFRVAGLPAELRRLVARYNEIVDREETDPSLKISFRRAPVRPSAAR